MNVHEHFWSKAFAGSTAAFAAIFLIGRFADAVVVSLGADAPTWVIQTLHLSSFLALFCGGWVASRFLSHDRGAAVPLGLALWSILGMGVLLLASWGISIYESAGMFGEVTDPELGVSDAATAWWNVFGIVLSLGASISGVWLGALSRDLAQRDFGTHRAPRVSQLFWRINHVARNHS